MVRMTLMNSLCTTVSITTSTYLQWACFLLNIDWLCANSLQIVLSGGTPNIRRIYFVLLRHRWRSPVQWDTSRERMTSWQWRSAREGMTMINRSITTFLRRKSVSTRTQSWTTPLILQSAHGMCQAWLTCIPFLRRFWMRICNCARYSLTINPITSSGSNWILVAFKSMLSIFFKNSF